MQNDSKAASSAFSHQDDSSSVLVTCYTNTCMENVDLRLTPSPDDISIGLCYYQGGLQRWQFFSGSGALEFELPTQLGTEWRSFMSPIGVAAQEVSQDMSHQVRSHKDLFVVGAGQFLLQSQGSHSPGWSTPTTTAKPRPEAELSLL